MNKYPNHAKDRAFTRYGIRLSNKRYSEIKRQLMNNDNTKLLGKASEGRLVYSVTSFLKPKNSSKEKLKFVFKVIWCPNICEIITFLPEDAKPDHKGRWRGPKSLTLRKENANILNIIRGRKRREKT